MYKLKGEIMSKLRRIVGSGTIRIKDDEVGEDEYGDYSVGGFAVIGEVLPSRQLEHGDKCVGGEVRFEIDLDAEYISGGGARIRGEARLFEGTSCSTSDVEDTQDINIIVPVDGIASVNIKLRSTGTGGGDFAKGRITFSNVAQPNGWRLPSYVPGATKGT